MNPEPGGLPGTVTAAVLADALNITVRRVQQLAKEGAIPKAEHGRYPFRECLHGYVKLLQERAYGGGEGGSLDFYAEKTRLTAAQAARAELEVARTRGTVVEKEEVARWAEWFVVTVRARLLQIPRKLGLRLCPDEPKRGEAEAAAEIHAILEELASDDAQPEWTPAGTPGARGARAPARGRAPSGAPGVPPATETNG